MSEDNGFASLNELLGYPPEKRLLIVNCDDVGMCHAVNQAVLPAFEAGLVQSCTAMVPVPSFAEFVAIKQANPHVHCGVHLTATSEWENYRWGPVSDRERVPSLLDEQGYFYKSEQDFFERAKPDEAKIEFRAQIEKAIQSGLNPTHLDSHMGAYHFDEDLFAVAQALAEEFDLTLRIGYPPRQLAMRKAGWIVVDRLWFDTYEVPLEQRENYYLELFRLLKPGVTELVIHCAVESEELDAICGETASHRVFDFTFFTGAKAKNFLAAEGIECISYKKLHDLNKQVKSHN